MWLKCPNTFWVEREKKSFSMTHTNHSWFLFYNEYVEFSQGQADVCHQGNNSSAQSI